MRRHRAQSVSRDTDSSHPEPGTRYVTASITHHVERTTVPVYLRDAEGDEVDFEPQIDRVEGETKTAPQTTRAPKKITAKEINTTGPLDVLQLAWDVASPDVRQKFAATNAVELRMILTRTRTDSAYLRAAERSGEAYARIFQPKSGGV
jgi:hypothetical protein